MRRGYANTPEGQVHYIIEEGEGEPLLLLHQSPRSSRMYLRLLPLLAERHRVIAMDMLGYGASDLPPVKEGVADVRDMARSVIHLLDALQCERTHLLGVHTGAYIASVASAEWPSRIGALVLVGYPYFVAKSDTQRIFAKAKEFGASLGAADSSDGSHLTRLWMRAYSDVQRNWLHTRASLGDPSASDQFFRLPSPHRAVETFLTPEERSFLHQWVIDYMQARSMGPIYQSMLSNDPGNFLSRIQASTLIIEADSPYESPLCRRGQEVAKLVSTGELVTLAGSDDNMAEFKAPELAEKVLDFLRRHPL